MRGVWTAPGRVNLIGEHTDYNGGWALPFAIDRRVQLEIATASNDSFGSSYVEGVALALRADGHDVPPTSVEITSDVPIGAGLSSSAALTCATALGLNDLYGLGLSRENLVLIAQRAENEYVGAPTGILDQSASLLCGEGHALFLDCRDRTTRQVALDLGGHRLLVVDTGVSHSHAGGGYGQRRSECEQAAHLLGVPSLRTAEDLSALPPLLRRRTHHVVSENQRVRETVACLENGDVAGIGALLTASHVSLRDHFEVSWPEADAVVEAALAAGADGARMIGGGFGGSVLVLAEDIGRLSTAVGPWVRQLFEVAPAGGAVRVF